MMMMMMMIMMMDSESGNNEEEDEKDVSDSHQLSIAFDKKGRPPGSML